MDEFVQLWVYLSSTPLFGLTATLVTYALAQLAYERLGRAPGPTRSCGRWSPSASCWW